MSDEIKEYRLPELHTFGDDMSKRWTIEFCVWDENQNDGKGKLTRKQKRIPVRFNYDQRMQMAQKYITALSLSLSNGWYIKKKKDRDLSKEPPELIIADASVAEAYRGMILIKRHSLKKGSIKDYRLCTNHFIEFIESEGLDQLLIKELDEKTCLKFLDVWQMNSQASNRTRNNKLRVLKTLTNDLIKRGFLEKNPWSKIEKLRVTEPQNYPFQKYHKEVLIPFMKENDKQLWYACQFLYYLFIRIGELENIKIEQVRWDQNQVMIPNTFKSGKAKYPTISEAFEKVILEMGILKMNPDWYVFGTGGKPGPVKMKKGNLTKRFSEVRDHLQIDSKYVFYCWKHTGNFDSALAGVNIKAIQRQNGHAKLEDTDKYLRSIGVEHNEQIRERQPDIFADITQ